MNGYSNNGFTQSLNGILSLTDGLGTTIENGTITTGDISGDDIVSNTVTTTTLKSTDIELSGNLTIDNNLTVDGTAYIKTINTTGDATVYPSATNIYIGSQQSTITYIPCYLDCGELAIFQKGVAANNTSTFSGITNDTNILQNDLTTDASSLFSTASTILNGGLIVKKKYICN